MTETTPLSLATLGAISATATVPAYERSQLTPGIVHFGVGNFHRAHQAVYLDDLFNLGRDHDWAIIGAGVTSYDAAMRDKLKTQDYLTTVVEQDVGRSAARVTGAMIDVLDPMDRKALVEKLADPTIRIVSMTITEGGYFINPATGLFDPSHPAIAADAATPDDAKTVFGLILAGLKARRAAGTIPFTVMSCDNIPGNGHVTQNAVTGLARLSDPEFADWIEATVAFPNGMVDRITPATGAREIEIAAKDYAIADQWPVFCEEFKQWVLEDHFPAGRPALEEVGVQFVEDVAPFEHMKIRILNGGHAAIAYPGELLDIHFVHEAMEDETIRAFLAKLERTEIVTCVPAVPGVVLDDYIALIERRFANPKIGDTIARLAQDGSNRQPKFILPSTADRLSRNEDVQGLALVSALWCRYFQGTSDSGRAITFNDANAERLKAAALKAKENPLEFLALDDIFGQVAQSEIFRKRFTQALTALTETGTRATLEAYLAGKLGD
ncbi:mannitol dehydrogenase [Xaviernesmea oryzae]|uniref:Mannitol dehydrogenase n=1 Tax=Xaviernesmea oryzae TaxID=464029 RepID=A0A1Q9B2S9_9HYPH|nr:mannitol dehydrogenase family protein [Xaviernesmea oryzae]OLP62318.1 mannitol dehydrogenase [Xaviernesmea oryzae]SEL96646.1 mannitol 2-dehydrogenase [Xaviernesmea oryzae]